jgi:transposase-like protein
MRNDSHPTASKEKLLKEVLCNAADGKAMWLESKRGSVQDALQAGYIEPAPVQKSPQPDGKRAIKYTLTPSGVERLAQMPASRSFATQENWREAAEMAASGCRISAIAKKFGTTSTSVSRWIDHHKKLLDLEQRRAIARTDESGQRSSRLPDDTLLSDVLGNFRIANVFRGESITTVGEARAYSDNEYLRMPNFGKTSLNKLRALIGYAE